MCYADGSIGQATSTCPMCKIFRPSASRCPHKTDVCHNRNLHPRYDIVHFKNAEVQTFNGCGYCKWARTNPPPTKAGYYNAGWPGCCRPPVSGESQMIPPADWRAVSHVHHIPIPPDVKALLEEAEAATRAGASLAHTPIIARPSIPPPSSPPMDRKNSLTTGSPTRSPTGTARTMPMAIPTAMSHSSGSPKQLSSSLTSNSSRGSVGNMAGSVPSTSMLDAHHAARRAAALENFEKRIEAAHTPPNRRSTDGPATMSHRPTARRPSVSSAFPSMSLSKVTVDAEPSPLLRRRASTTMGNTHTTGLSAMSQSGCDRQTTPLRIPTKAASMNDAMSTLSLSDSSDSGSGSSRSSQHDGTDTSNGGFTDYLSDESEAELQRQAEAKALLYAQNQAEEQEFKAARQQLANVGLRPPKAWNPVSGPFTPSTNSQRYPQVRPQQHVG